MLPIVTAYNGPDPYDEGGGVEQLGQAGAGVQRRCQPVAGDPPRCSIVPWGALESPTHVTGAGIGDAEGAWITACGSHVVMSSRVYGPNGSSGRQLDVWRLLRRKWVRSARASKLLDFCKVVGIAADNTGRLAVLVERTTSVELLIAPVGSNAFVEHQSGFKTGPCTISARGNVFVVSGRGCETIF